jgi:hypothetical protein
MNFIKKLYHEAVREHTLSGNHKPFSNYCTSCPYPLVYYKNIVECDNKVLGSLACLKLPEGVKRSSLDDRKKKKNQSMKVPAPHGDPGIA